MKKLLAILLAVTLCLVFTACGDKNDADKESDSSNLTTTSTEESSSLPTSSNDVASVSSKTENKPTSTTTPSKTTTTSKPTSSTQTYTELRFGTTTGNKYQNSTIGLGFTAPSGWVFYTKEQIAEINQLTAEVMNNAKVNELLTNTNVLYDMMASDALGNSVNVIFEKLSVSLTVDQYIALSTPQLKQVLLDSGCSEVNTEATSKKIGGKTEKCISVIASGNGVTVYEMIFCKKVNGHMVCITAASQSQTELNNIINKFFAA